VQQVLVAWSVHIPSLLGPVEGVLSQISPSSALPQEQVSSPSPQFGVLPVSSPDASIFVQQLLPAQYPSLVYVALDREESHSLEDAQVPQ